MKIKDRPLPHRLQLLEALARWMPVNHHQYTQLLDEIRRRRAGYNGEKELDYNLRFLP